MASLVTTERVARYHTRSARWCWVPEEAYIDCTLSLGALILLARSLVSLGTVNSGVHGPREYSYLYITRQWSVQRPRDIPEEDLVVYGSNCIPHMIIRVPGRYSCHARGHKSASSEARCLASQHAVSAFCEGVGQENWA